jgi:hypothetical protein
MRAFSETEPTQLKRMLARYNFAARGVNTKVEERQRFPQRLENMFDSFDKSAGPGGA